MLVPASTRFSSELRFGSTCRGREDFRQELWARPGFRPLRSYDRIWAEGTWKNADWYSRGRA